MPEEKPTRKRPPKTINDIKIVILSVNGERKDAYSVADAIVYMGYSETGFRKFLDRHPEIKRYAKGKDEDTRARYILKEDLDREIEAHPVEDKEED